MAGRCRAWTFTWNNYADGDFESVLESDCKYVVVGKEVGESGTPHLQGFIVMKSVKALAQMKRLWSDAVHWEPAKGDSEANLKYCSKDGDWEERGERPMSLKEQGVKGQDKWKEILKEAREAGEVSDNFVQFKEYKHVRHHYTQEKAKGIKPIDGPLEHEWIWGPTGTGKSSLAMKGHPGAYVKEGSKWWDQYEYQDVVIIDDLEPDDAAVRMLKKWADRWPIRVEEKGGMMLIRPRKFIVTSNYPPTGMFNSTDLGPILRKFKVTELKE